MSKLSLFDTLAPDGYSYICSACPIDRARYGPVIFGPREVIIKKCAKHEQKKGLRDEDMERVEKASWAIDPPPVKFYRKCRDPKRNAYQD